MSDRYYIATIPLSYDIVALGKSRNEATELASREALAWLTKRSALTDRTDTCEKIVDYFGVMVVEIGLHEATVAM
jgi:hypothetical protein